MISKVLGEIAIDPVTRGGDHNQTWFEVIAVRPREGDVGVHLRQNCEAYIHHQTDPVRILTYRKGLGELNWEKPEVCFACAQPRVNRADVVRGVAKIKRETWVASTGRVRWRDY
ncbi:unnamed protein product [Protopolystoma xenopodis]|uniref:Uncharacterized protein n=1 Tax=Protopolystoma xenopodis TaxID=117903 RepID=A0A3S5B1L5_9PLAT|nr:unnamed protein product [Protopolystoma xenopodis]